MYVTQTLLGELIMTSLAPGGSKQEEHLFNAVDYLSIFFLSQSSRKQTVRVLMNSTVVALVSGCLEYLCSRCQLMLFTCLTRRSFVKWHCLFFV